VVLGDSLTDMTLGSRQGVCYLRSDSREELLGMAKIAMPSGKEEAGSETSLFVKMTGDSPRDGRLAGACHAIQPEYTRPIGCVPPGRYFVEKFDACIWKAITFVVAAKCIERSTIGIRKLVKDCILF
jgi:hypothetical protein